ncbi:MAG: hypothetical protein JWO67_5758, partial [Streptosporangiaceae bacterium]|nr:hypothetical protein [Streptosporangiaceae bacterium]
MPPSPGPANSRPPSGFGAGPLDGDFTWPAEDGPSPAPSGRLATGGALVGPSPAAPDVTGAFSTGAACSPGPPPGTGADGFAGPEDTGGDSGLSDEVGVGVFTEPEGVPVPLGTEDSGVPGPSPGLNGALLEPPLPEPFPAEGVAFTGAGGATASGVSLVPWAGAPGVASGVAGRPLPGLKSPVTEPPLLPLGPPDLQETLDGETRGWSEPLPAVQPFPPPPEPSGLPLVGVASRSGGISGTPEPAAPAPLGLAALLAPAPPSPPPITAPRPAESPSETQSTWKGRPANALDAAVMAMSV